MKNATILDEVKGFVESKVGVHLPPFPSVPEVRKVEAPVPRVLQPSKTDIEERGNTVRPGSGILGHEVVTASPPLRVDIDEVVEPRLLGRRLNIRRFDVTLNKPIALRRDLSP